MKNNLKKVFVGVLCLIGASTIVLIVTGLVLDVSTFDETSGGYEYPYSGWTGSPIDFTEAHTTSAGMYQPGYVANLYINCSTGMVTYDLLKIVHGSFREFSDRAKVVHKPQLACQERGFDTSSWDAVNAPLVL